MFIYPGSDDYEKQKKEKKIPENFKWDRPLYSSDQNLNDLQKLLIKANIKFYFRIYFIKNRIFALFRNPRCEISRYLNAVKYVIGANLTVIASKYSIFDRRPPTFRSRLKL